MRIWVNGRGTQESSHQRRLRHVTQGFEEQ